MFQQRYSILISFLVLFFSIKAQDDVYHSRFGIEVLGGKTRAATYALYPSLVYNVSRHTMFAGPGIYYTSFSQSRPITGLQAGYQYALITTRRLDLFCEYSLNYMNGRFTDHFQPSTYTSFEGVRSRTIHLQALDHYFSIGLKWGMGSRFYASCVMGAGFGLYRQDYSYTFYNNQTLSQTGPLALRYGPTLIGKLGLGFYFLRLKKAATRS